MTEQVRIPAQSVERLPEAGHPDFIGPLTVEQQVKLDYSYLPESLPGHTKQVLHAGVDAQISRMAALDKLSAIEVADGVKKQSVSHMSNSELAKLRATVFAARQSKASKKRTSI